MTDNKQIADLLRTAPLGNAAREAAARHFAGRLNLTAEERERFVQRALGHAPEIANVGL